MSINVDTCLAWFGAWLEGDRHRAWKKMMAHWMLSVRSRATPPCPYGQQPRIHPLLYTLNQFSQTVGDLTSLLESIARAACWALTPTDCIIWLRADPSKPAQPGTDWIGSKPPAYLVDGIYESCPQWNVSPVAELTDSLLRTALLEAGISLVAPLIYQGEVLGWLGVGPPRRGRIYSAEKQCFLAILAWQAALAIQNIRFKTELDTSVTQLRRAYQQTIQTQENERRQLAEALHDETLQHLADISVRLGLLQCRSEIRPADLEDIQTRLARADRYLREMVRGIHPAILADLGLVEAVIAFLDSLPSNHYQTSVRVELDITGFYEQRLPDQNLELALYRFIQNGLINALTHGQTGYIQVELKWEQDLVEVRVTDDGCGMSTTIEEASRAGHFGLLTMRERIEALGGKFTLFSAPGGGTQVRGHIPLTTPSPAPGKVEHYIFELVQSKTR